MQNAKFKMQNEGVSFADIFNHALRAYLNFAFYILHFALRKGDGIRRPFGFLTYGYPAWRSERDNG